MGNCKSCINAVVSTATLVDSHGRLLQIKAPISAAEIMLDNSGHVVAPELLIRQTRKITAMKADEELLPGKIYLLVPSSRVNSRVSGSEMKLVDNASNKKKRAKRRRSKVLPTDNKPLPTLMSGDGTGMECHRVSYSCPWRPALEPILEEIGSFRVNYKEN